MTIGQALRFTCGKFWPRFNPNRRQIRWQLPAAEFLPYSRFMKREAIHTDKRSLGKSSRPLGLDRCRSDVSNPDNDSLQNRPPGRAISRLADLSQLCFNPCSTWRRPSQSMSSTSSNPTKDFATSLPSLLPMLSFFRAIGYRSLLTCLTRYSSTNLSCLSTADSSQGTFPSNWNI